MQILDKEADSQDQKFQDHVSRQIKQLMKRAKTEETNADKEDQKGLQLDAKAKHTCKIADYLQNTDDGLEARAHATRGCNELGGKRRCDDSTGQQRAAAV